MDTSKSSTTKKCGTVFNSFGHVCARASGHAGPHCTSAASQIAEYEATLYKDEQAMRRYRKGRR